MAPVNQSAYRNINPKVYIHSHWYRHYRHHPITIQYAQTLHKTLHNITTNQKPVLQQISQSHSLQGNHMLITCCLASCLAFQTALLSGCLARNIVSVSAVWLSPSCLAVWSAVWLATLYQSRLSGSLPAVWLSGQLSGSQHCIYLGCLALQTAV